MLPNQNGDMMTEQNKLSYLEKLKRQKQTLEARIQKAEAMNRDSERKADTRRKILLGAYYLEKLKIEGSFDSIKHALDGFLKRNSDRKLFGLPVLEDETA